MKITQLLSSQKKLGQLITKFPFPELDKIHFDKWSLITLLAHIANWNNILGKNIEDMLNGSIPTHYGSVSATNQALEKQAKNYKYSEVTDSLHKSETYVSKLYSQLPKEMVNKPLWQGKNSTPESLYRILVHHYEEHILQIARILEKLG